MISNNLIQPSQKLWRFLPYFSKLRGLLFFNKIYLRQDIYENLQSSNPDPYFESILIHELEHLKRSREQGWLKYGCNYIFTRKGRLEEELAAVRAQMQFLKSKGQNYPYIERTAKALSGPYYLWAGEYQDIKKSLEKIWITL
jgi:hypothetical protein